MSSKFNLPKEGDLLFEKKNISTPIIFGFFFIFLFFIYDFVPDLIDNFNDWKIGFVIFTISYVIFSTLIVIVSGVVIYRGIKYGFNDETYQGYYFKDKIVFYRISKYVDKIYTKGMKKEQILAEIIKLKDIANSNSNEGISARWEIFNYEKGLKIIENPGPHKIELSFCDVKYFINDKELIKVIKITDDENFNDTNRFNSELKLAKGYKKHSAEVVDFLNKQVVNNKSSSEEYEDDW